MSVAPVPLGAEAHGFAFAHSRRIAAARPIAIVLHDLRGGGAERASLRLARGMAAAGRKVDLVLVRGEGAYLDDVPPDVRLHVLGCARVSKAIGALARYFRQARPRAVLSALTHMNIATAAAACLSRVPMRLVLSERNQISCKVREARGFWQRALYRSVPLAYRAADSVVAVSDGVARDLAGFGRLPKQQLRVIHNPVFDPAIISMAQAHPSHPWFEQEGSPPIILAAGRLHRQKGFDVLLKAFAIARSEIDCRLVILGEGAERDALAKAGNELGLGYDIDMPGFVANPFALMARAGAFVLPSRWEGFPNALVEAMACGAPVIAADCPSGPHEILAGGRYGHLVPLEDSATLGRALVETLSSRPDTRASVARAQSFSIATAAAQYLDALEA
jgi:glycosyltransferase involved in cell wall biosynthesis